MLDSLDKGCGCKGGISIYHPTTLPLDPADLYRVSIADEGQDEVNRTYTVMTEAQKTLTTAEEELVTVTNTDVHLSSQKFSLLQTGECGWIKTDAAYLSAETAYNEAVERVRTTTEAHTRAIFEHTTSVIKAKEMKEHCECETQSNHETQWTDANMDNEANQRAWAQSRHIDCVIAHTSEANCGVDSCPVVRRPVLCDDIETKKCEEAGSASGSAGEGAPLSNAPNILRNCALARLAQSASALARFSLSIKTKISHTHSLILSRTKTVHDKWLYQAMTKMTKMFLKPPTAVETSRNIRKYSTHSTHDLFELCLQRQSHKFIYRSCTRICSKITKIYKSNQQD